MSQPQATKLPEAKTKSKFQSLNINNIYQGAANKNASKSLPQKHGLQSLGKVPTARRAPANLPSVKSEKGGNDPTVVLVPTGGSGWTKDGEKPASLEKQDISNSAPKTEVQKESPPPASLSKPSGPKSWSSVTGASQGKPQTFGHQKSPRFGQEFPSLRMGEGGGGGAEESQAPAGRLQLDSQAGRDELTDRPNYGPGPILRPQTFGNWTQGGIKGPGAPTESLQSDSDPIIPPQPHKPIPPGAASQLNHKSPQNHIPSNQYKSIMPPFMDVMELPTGPPENLGPRRISRDRPGSNRREPPPRGRPFQNEFTPPSIIDKEKLRRMDDLAGDDWTYDDDNFDYNKRLQSDDEEIEPEIGKTDPNWADQVEKAHSSQPYNFYEEMKKPGFGVEEEEKRRTKKSEEVMKNIERARQRREEEENRYRRPGSEEYFKGDERPSLRRQEEGLKENRTPVGERKDFIFEEKRGKPRPFEERRENRFEERAERGFEDPRGGQSYYPPRFERMEEKSRLEEYRNFDDSHFEEDYKQYGRKEQARSFDDREKNRNSEESRPFTDFTNTEENRVERRWSGRSPVYNRQSSQISNSESLELENGTAEWGVRPSKSVCDWAEDVETVVFQEKHEFEADPVSRPNSRDSRISKDSRGSREGKMSRSSAEKSKKLPEFLEEKPRKAENPLLEYDQEKKAKKTAPAPDLRGYFRDTVEENKKMARAAPGPITREKLEAAEIKDVTGMTQLKKRDTKPEPSRQTENEMPEKLNPLIDSDMLENISDDEEGLLDTLEREEKGGAARARGRGRGQAPDIRKFAPLARGTRGGERGGRGVRGGRGDIRGKGGHGRFGEMEHGGEESDEARKNRKNYEKFPENFNQPPPGPFMPRGQPSRRGRGESKVRGNFVGRGGRHNMEGPEDLTDDMGDWMNEDEYGKGRGGKVPPRMQRKREENRPTNKADGEDVDEWETASEHSNEERRKREAERGRGRGARGWEQPRGAPRRGGMHGYDNRELTPEADAMKKRSGIDNIDLHDFAGVVVVDQEMGHLVQELDQNEAGEFMQVVNRKIRPPPPVRDDRRSFERTGPKIADKGGYDPKYRDPREAFNKQNKTSYERRQNKLPPRLAKVREVSRAQARTGGISPSGLEQNGWPEGDKMGVFQVEDLGTTAWEKPPPRREKEGSEGPDMRGSPKTGKENGGIQQTMVFENTALKGGKGDKMDKTGIQLPVGMGKSEDNIDVVKLDFTFGGDDLSSQGKPPMSITRSMPHLASSQGLPASPSTDDLSAKLANTKKLWDSPGMAVVPENPVSAASNWNDGSSFNESPGFDGFQDNGAQSKDNMGGYDKQENGPNPGNVPKIKQPPQQLVMDQDNRPTNPMQFGRMANNAMPGAIPSPPTQMGHGSMGAIQPQPWAFPLDRSNNMYNPYGPGQLNQSMLMQGTHSIGTDLFTGSNGAGGYRLQGTGHYPGSQQSSANNVLISQANLISSGVKHANQIGPIGTKAGTGGNTSYMPSGLGTLPNTFIQYEPSSFNYVNANPASLQRGNGPPTQTAFYQSLASRQPQIALNAMSGSYNHAMSQQQMRAGHVAGLPYMKNDMSGLANQKSPLGDNFGNNYNGRAGGPPSPKTKMKMEQQHQQQQQAKMAGMNNLNNLNQLAQLRMNSLGSLGYNIGIPGYPSPIARPQMNHGGGPHGMHGSKVDYYTQEVGVDEKVEGEMEKGGDGSKEAEVGAEKDQGEQEAADAAQ